MSQQPLLSVCIPTFKRRALLQENLNTLLPQAEALGVEVCVCANHASDDTPALLEDLAGRFTCLRFMRQERTVGIDQNMQAAIGMASGRYVYPLGDDDVVPEGHLAAILEVLSQPADVVVLNGWHTDARLVPRHLHLNSSTSGRGFTTAAQAFEALWDKMPFGAFLAARDCFFLTPPDRYLGTSHAYTGVVWDALGHLQDTRGAVEVRCTQEPLVMIRGAEKTWRANADLILLQEIPAWFALVAQHPAYAEVAGRIRQHYLKRQTSLGKLVRLRAAGQLRPRDVGRLTDQCNEVQARRIRSVSRLPQPLARQLVRLVGLVTGKHQPLPA